MKIKTSGLQEYEFYLQHCDNYILVENHADEVIIRATRDNISEQSKSSFIRYLAMEGYIPDHYEWFSYPTGDGRGVKWTINRSWLKLHPGCTRIANAFMYRFLSYGILLWVVLMAFLFLSKA